MSSQSADELIYHVCRAEEWDAAKRDGTYRGSSQDHEDGFIHFSALAQLRGSVAKHRVGQDGLVLLGVDPSLLASGVLKWEPSRGGALFPHLYDDLPVSAAVRVDDLPLGSDGAHAFPADLPEDA